MKNSMKKKYVKPEVAVTAYLYEGFLCATMTKNVRFGNVHDKYGTAGWLDEGYTDQQVELDDGRPEGGEAISIVDDSSGDLDSRSKGGGLWADDDEDW